MQPVLQVISQELSAHYRQVEAAVALLDGGATVPFIARYRKEATGGLDDTQLRLLEQRLGYLRELEGRRAAVLKSIDEQGKLSDALRAEIEGADTKQRLEDLYMPYRPKRRTKAQMAREAGLEPLADELLDNPAGVPEELAVPFINAGRGVADVPVVLEGARQILMERFAEDPALTGRLRERLWAQGILVSRVMDGKETEGAKFSDYFDYREAIRQIPSHRALALFRGRNLGILSLELLAGDGDQPDALYRWLIAERFGIIDCGRPGDAWLQETVRKAWRIKLLVRLDLDLKGRLMEAAEAEAIRVFARNLKALLLTAPAGRLPTIGLDPGLRTGVKLAVVDATGRAVDTDTLYPHVPKQQWDASIDRLAALARQYGVRLISIGNGTASRETDKLARELVKRYPELGLRSLVVNEAGASVYSASAYASQEFPDLDVSLRGAVSIARRLQDPLAELVKIEPKSIGVGQYQHDVDQAALARALDAVVEDCVNAVGVDLNTASVPLLAQVSGVTPGIAENLVRYREQNGAFRSRAELKQVPRLGAKSFQQCAGFLRVNDGDEPLDASAVHPEAYALVHRIAKHTGKRVGALVGDAATLRGIEPRIFADATFGEATVRDILTELEKPGRDPRPEFRAAEFKDGVETLVDLKPGMVLEGSVTNVTNFGAFVDIGVHQDGLVHVSMLADRFVKDPHEVVQSGQLVRVKVLEVDPKRKRIALSMRADERTDRPVGLRAARQGQRNRYSDTKGTDESHNRRPPGGRQNKRAIAAASPAAGTMADAFAKARRR